jgi:hypothetical protein
MEMDQKILQMMERLLAHQEAKTRAGRKSWMPRQRSVKRGGCQGRSQSRGAAGLCRKTEILGERDDSLPRCIRGLEKSKAGLQGMEAVVVTFKKVRTE